MSACQTFGLRTFFEIHFNLCMTIYHSVALIYAHLQLFLPYASKSTPMGLPLHLISYLTWPTKTVSRPTYSLFSFCLLFHAFDRMTSVIAFRVKCTPPVKQKFVNMMYFLVLQLSPTTQMKHIPQTGKRPAGIWDQQRSLTQLSYHLTLSKPIVWSVQSPTHIRLPEVHVAFRVQWVRASDTYLQDLQP